MQGEATTNDRATLTGRAALLAACRRAVGTPARRWLAAGTLGLGLVSAVLVTIGTPPAERSFAAVSGPVQSLMSITVPFLAILLVADLRRRDGPDRIAPTLLATLVVAVAVALFGLLICAIATALAPSAAAEGRWYDAGVVALGSLLVQVVARSTGTGFGLLLRSRAAAMLATFVPLGCWLILGAIEALRPARDWLTPYASVRNVFSGQMSPLRWAQWCVVVLIWAVALNVVGAVRLARETSATD